MVERVLVVGLLIAGLEVLQGILRVRLLNHPLGDHRARQVGVFTGSAMILLVTWLFRTWIGADTRSELLEAGAIWVVQILGLDLAVGRWVFRFTWARIARDFDPRRGGLLGIGMLVLFFAPLIVAELTRAH